MERTGSVSLPASRRARGLAVFAVLLGLTALAAHASSIRRATGTPDTRPAPQPAAPVIEVAFVLDTTGSMSGLIEGAKRRIWEIASQMASGRPTPHIRMGLVAYRDRGDAYVTRFYDLSADLDALYGHLQALQAGGGGDTPESVDQALYEAVHRMQWTPGREAYKVVFLVGDAPPHRDYPDDVPYDESVRTARRRGIVVNTVQCGNLAQTTPIWRAIASAGAGRYAAIRQDGGMLAMATPHDADLARLNRELADTILAWGDEADRAETHAKRRLALEASDATAASRLAYLAKSGGRVNGGRADLVDAYREGRADPRTLPAEALPPTLRELPPETRQAYVEERLETRARIQREIAAISAEREAWLRADRERRAAAGERDGFDTQVLRTIREQAAAKGIVY